VIRTLDFKDHRRELLANRYVYAVVSRRARGLSIGLNLNPDKVCNFDCPYCQVDRTTPGGPPDVDVPALLGELERLLELVAGGELWTTSPFDTVAPALRRVADLAFAGDGEPTTPREFPEAARAVRAARDRHGLAVPIRLLTNATLLHRERVHAALEHFDELWCKLDAGTEAYFQKVDGTRFPFARILDNLRAISRERPIVIQSLFLAFAGIPPEEAEIDAYCGRLRDLVAGGGRIDLVQVYTVSRPPADPAVSALPLARLESIAGRVRALGLAAEVFGP
jgi:wyosine [tRNA(Phe)-imidazoG37] synthetase (radical SAM superfamily)